MKKIIVAIDGHSSCGKSTMAKALAKEIGYIYIDTGAMYRAVTLFALRRGFFHGDEIDASALEAAMGEVHINFQLDAATGLPLVCLNGEVVENEIRGMEVSSRVSPIAALPFVRIAMTRQQQEMGREKGIVMDGRDIGTVVLPQAELKIFLVASVDERAERRYKENLSKGIETDLETLKEEIAARDYKDSHRETSPLKQAEDAIYLDTTGLSILEVVEKIKSEAQKHL